MALPDNMQNMQAFQSAKASPSPWLMPLFTILSSVLSAVVSVVVAFELLQSNQRLDHAAIEQINKSVASLSSDLKEIRQGMPNTGAYDIKISQLEARMAGIESDLKAEDYIVQSVKTDVKIALRELERRR